MTRQATTCAICGGRDATVRGYLFGSEGRGFAQLCHRCVTEAIENYWQVQYPESGSARRIRFARRRR